ncbi:hypothetical protein LTR91_006482 [Friedmanniomyces endolithicus]|uniref:Deacetylase sirtuin-type domain-containing protein n=2 Tax=Dothideomycetidae TaxID=451867 RepID=A0AAN6KRZ2_9PEZI|nr:hypothetical protein LTS09_012947 [Friedmanniomyces endolithicus]KAK5140211.1 hypothetical protein LTR32_006920 [Rachicladosporium monterosium]KAK0345316.1 hypothetical protein LTR94_011277 [Friedmanniomyces endolithicus]KAK0786213.1 hypothetical protein LTR59_010773 [Friedmanniomyces endolithicus]KAK0799815.1 hypothetical protein LTR75_009087 [Friedmanniomyces endolithicus]
MASSTTTSPVINAADLASFHEHLKKSARVLALLGAGLSASSGLPTFRGAGGLWRTHDATSIATPEAFNADPSLVWQFYSYRRHAALQAQPNPAHYALAKLARKMPGFQALSQNVDGLSPRVDHPPGQLQLLHGSLFEVRCTDRRGCGYSETNFTDPIVPALAIPTLGIDPSSDEARQAHSDQLQAKRLGNELDISNINVPLPSVKTHDLPICPKCQKHLLRPGVVWFGESLPKQVLDKIDDFVDAGAIDMIMVIGTSAKVYPAAGYTEVARGRGARVCVVNMDENDRPAGGWKEGDWFFKGDAAVLVPMLLEPVIGQIGS